MDEKKTYSPREWLETATKGIRFGPDRRAVRAELREHLEDKAADMVRIFHIEGEEAEREALKRMGDPEEIGRKLAKIHKPWLGYLWLASLGLIAVAAALFICCIPTLFVQWIDGPGPAPRNAYDAVVDLEPEQVKLGGYTFQIMEAKQESGLGYVTLRVSYPKFWEPADGAGVLRALTVVLEDGTRIHLWGTERTLLSYGVSYSIFAETEATREGKPVLDEEVDMDASPRYQGLFYQDISIKLRQGAHCQTGDRITLELNYPTERAVLSARLTEGVR